MTGPGKLTRFRTLTPKTLGKTFKLKPGGTLDRGVAGQMAEGLFTVETFHDAADLVGLIKATTTAEALSSSLPTSATTSGRVVTERALKDNPGDFARSKRFFNLPAGQPGLFCFDADAAKDGPPLSREQLWQVLLTACPALASAGVIYWPSGSSEIWSGSTQHRGVSGQHFYLMVLDLADTQRFGRAISARLWQAGHGSIHISASGALLPRTIFDEAVHQPARLLFVGGSVCTPPLEQRRGDPTVISDGGFLDTRAALTLTPEEEGQYLALVESAKAQAAPRAHAARQAWRDGREKELLSKAVDQGADIQEAQDRISKTLDAALGGTLLGTFPLVTVDPQGKETVTTVDHVLKNRARFHLSTVLDPLNNDHRERSPDAILWLNQSQPVCYSLDDGGTVYRLLAQPVRLAVVAGGKAQLADQIASHLAQEQDLFNSAGRTVRVTGGDFAPLSRPMLQYRIGCAVSLYRQGTARQTSADPDQPLIEMTAALLPERLRKLTGRSSLPLIDVEGRIMQTLGFDSDSGLYLDLKPDDVEPVPHAPTRQQTIEALKRLWRPWSSYTWCSPNDRAAMLATVLTTPFRPTIAGAPGLMVDAAGQSAGKSKAIGAIAAVIRGHRAGLKTWQGDNDVEVEKYLLSVARTGDPVIAWDNITGVLRSPSLATVMVEGKLNARVLGVNEVGTPECRAQFLGSGNNCALDRDMATRWLQARIAVTSQNPSAARFPFDPVDAALSDRHGIARAAIIVHRAWHEAGRPRADQVGVRFSEWGKTVRQITLWLRDYGLAEEAGIGDPGDPAFSILQGSSLADPESESLSLLLSGLNEIFQGASFSAGDVVRHVELADQGGDEAQQTMNEGLSGLLSGSARRFGKLSAQTVTWVFKNRRERPVSNLVLVQMTQPTNTGRPALWQVRHFKE